MLTERVRASYEPDQILQHLEYVRQTAPGIYPTRRPLRLFFTEVDRVYRAEAEDEPFYFDELRRTYRAALLGHAATVESLSIEDLDDVDRASNLHMHTVEVTEVGERGMRAAMSPLEHAAEYVREAFTDTQLEPWYQDVVGRAMWYIDAVHRGGCIDTQPDNLHDVSCLGCAICPHKVIASRLLLPIRQSRDGALGDIEHSRTKRLTDALLRTAILNGFTSFQEEEAHVEWLFNRGRAV